MGTAFETLELPAPDRSRPGERPLTQWAFEPPPPNPPGIGIAIAGPEDSPKQSPGGVSLGGERPITQWFPSFQPEAEKKKNESKDLSLRTVYPYANSIADATEGELPSPLSPSSSSNATPNSPPTAVSPLRSPISSPLDFEEPRQAQFVQFPKRSTSLSKASRYAPRSTKRATGEPAPLQVKEVNLRRTQSNAEGPRPMDWRGPSPQSFNRERIENPRVRDLSPHDMKVQEPPRHARHSPKPLNIIKDPHLLPPLTSAPPNVPLPAITGPKLAGQGKARDQLHMSARSSSSDRSLEKSPSREFDELTEGSQSGAEHKLTAKERFWLHRHYRGEAMFLKAWGLQITSEEDREEGRGILREIMDGEAQEEREQQARQRMHHRSGSQSRSSTGTTASGRDGASLDVIAEERLSREFHLQSVATSPNPNSPNPNSPNPNDGGEDRFWKIEHETTRDSRRGRRPGPEKHTRNESTDSVLGQYLDLRLSHNR